MVAEFGDKERFTDVRRIDFLEFTPTEVDAGISEPVKRGIGAVDITLVIFRVDVTLHPGSGNMSVKGDIVLCLARFYAKAAANALVGINQKGPLDVRIFGEHFFGVDQRQGRNRH